MRTLLLILVSAASACATSRGDVHPHAHHRFDNAQQWAAVFDDPARDTWQKPEETIAALELRAQDRVADLGAGTGYFSVRLARAVSEGEVFAIDVEPSMVEHLRHRTHQENLRNLHPVLAEPADPKIPTPVDVILVVDTYHHISHRPDYFRRLVPKLKPGGRLVIVDFKKGQPLGPPEEARIPESQVEAELREAGYVRKPAAFTLPNQYFLVFTVEK